METIFARVKKVALIHIIDWSKPLEIRVGDRLWNQIREEDQIIFTDQDGQQHPRRVVTVRRYDSFEDMLQYENHSKIMPGWTRAEILRGLRTIYPREKEALGVLVFELGRVTA